MTRSALEVVTLYNLEVWNKGRIELVPELCAERMTRYDANSVTTLNIDEQIARIRHNYDELRPTFEPVVLDGGDEYVTLVWNVTGRDPNWRWCGIEVFRVVDGKIVEVWNGPYVDGRWIRGGTLAASAAGGIARPIPVMSATLEGDHGQLTTPLDTASIAHWLEATFGAPDIDAGGRRFHWRADRPALDISYARHGERPRGLSHASIERLEIRWARSGLTNVTIDLIGTCRDDPAWPAKGEDMAIRLAECRGQFCSPGLPPGNIVGASIALDPATRTASGELTMRIPVDVAPDALIGGGRLEFGWYEGSQALRFEAAATLLGEPEGIFTDGDEREAVFSWRAADIVASLVLRDESAPVD
jgi:hypothetical protein